MSDDTARQAEAPRIFVVEDEALIAMELQDRLEALGYTFCGSASRGEQAVEAILSARPDLVLMDVRLAGDLNGIETARQLREHVDLPVIFLSAYSDGELLRRAGEVEPFGYLVKPFEERELHATIQMALYKHRAERALREANARLDEKVRQRTAELTQSREDLQVTLNSIADAVLSTDVNGLITRMNPAAEELTGWSQLEAAGMPVSHVLRLVDAVSREPLAVPLAVVLATGQKQALPNDTLLIARDGTERSIADSAAPIRDASGRIVGAVLVFRDETEAREIDRQRRAAEESLRRLNASLEAEVERRTAERRKVETVFETLAALSPVGIVGTDAFAQCRYVNQRYCEMLGIEREEALGSGWLRTTLHEEDRDRVLDEWDRALHLEQPFRAECRFQRPDGQTVYALAQAVPTRDASGMLTGYIGTLTDLTEQKQIDLALRALSTELVALQGKAFFAVMAQRLARLLGCEMALVGAVRSNESGSVRSLALVIDDRIRPDIELPLHETPWSGLQVDPEVLIPSGARRLHPDNAWFGQHAVEAFAAVALQNHAGTCIGLLVVMSRQPFANPAQVAALMRLFAISATAHLEQERSLRRFHDLFEFSPDALVLTDRSGAIRLVNRRAEAMFGWPRAELVGQGLHVLLPEHEAELQGSLAGPSPAQASRTDLRARRKDGEVFPIEVSFGTLDTSEGPMLAAAFRDVTERRNAERQANRAQRLAAIGTLAGGIAHDLNNALTPILLTFDLLKQQYPEEHEMLETVEQSARHAAEMVRHLLAFAKGTGGRRVAVPVRRIVDEVTRIMRGTFPKNLELHVNVANELPHVLGDATQLHQVLLNLCVNARDAMPAGGTLTLTAEVVEACFVADEPEAAQPHTSRYVVLSVSDTGAGIAPDVIDRIFDPFFTTKSPEGGSGLGLFTAAGIVKRHGGFIRVDSRIGRGSTFSVYLPAQESPVAGDAEPGDVRHFQGHGEMVLFVDDEAAIRESAGTVLARLNFHPLLAEDGMTGLLQAFQSRNRLRAVITDVHMPHMDGLAFVRALRRALPDVPVIVASGRFEPVPAQEFEKLGVEALLEKPFTQATLAEALRKALSATAPSANAAR